MIEQLEDRRLLAIGDSALEPGISAFDILNQRPGASDGVYWIDPDGPGSIVPFQVYADMTTDGGGWMLAVNSVAGSEAPSNRIDANVGSPQFSTGHTRNVQPLLAGGGEFRHQIDAGAQGLGTFHAKYSSADYFGALPGGFGAWTNLGTSNPNLLQDQYGRSWSSTPFGAEWYYSGQVSAIPSTPANGSAGPTVNGATQVIQSYRIWVRELDTPDFAPPPPSTPDLDPTTDTGISNTDDITFASSVTFAGTAFAGPAHGVYELNGTLADRLKRTDLIGQGGVTGPSFYSFGPNQGLILPQTLPDPSEYTLEFVVNLSNPGPNGWSKLVDFADRSADAGLYFTPTGALRFHSYADSGASIFVPNTDFHLTLTREASTGHVAVYVDGSLRFSFNDGAGAAVANSVFRLFQDDFVTSQVESPSGLVRRVRLFDAALPPGDVAHLFSGGSPFELPSSPGIATVELSSDLDGLLGTASVDDGLWSLTTSDLSLGVHQIHAVAIQNPGYRVSQPSAPLPVTITPGHGRVQFVGAFQDSQGDPLTGEHDLQLAVYDSASGGSALYSETLADVALGLSPGGYFQHAITALGNAELQQDLYVQVSVDGNPLNPRLRINHESTTLSGSGFQSVGSTAAAVVQRGDTASYSQWLFGYLRDASGNPVTGSQQLQLSLYDAQTGGSPLWSDTATVAVDDAHAGRMAIELGTVTPLDLQLFSSHSELWVEIAIAGETPAPRLRFDGGQQTLPLTAAGLQLVSAHASSAADAWAGVQGSPITTNVFGFLRRAGTGNPLPGTHSITFRLYDSPSGGALLYSETASIDVEDDLLGSFAHGLGTIQPLSRSLLTMNETVYLELEIDGRVSETPRTAFSLLPSFAVAAIDVAPFNAFTSRVFSPNTQPADDGWVFVDGLENVFTTDSQQTVLVSGATSVVTAGGQDNLELRLVIDGVPGPVIQAGQTSYGQ
ncbi:MAG: hypothetical protein KJ000_16425, partial [Pirellulaceae bacterium]|nr:hypothetical protein [Pirellulaceae bacterium]